MIFSFKSVRETRIGIRFFMGWQLDHVMNFERGSALAGYFNGGAGSGLPFVLRI